MSGIWTHDHWIPFRRSNRLSYEAMSSTRTQSQLCTAIPISSFVQCQVSHQLLSSSVATFILIEIFIYIWRWILQSKQKKGELKWKMKIWALIYFPSLMDLYVMAHLWLHLDLISEWFSWVVSATDVFEPLVW